MSKKLAFSLLSFAVILLLIYLLARLTESGSEDPCENPQADISAAVLAEGEGDQEGMVNRAILARGECEARRKKEQQE